MLRRLKIAGICLWLLMQSTAIAGADDLKGHVQESNLPGRVKRPPMPPIPAAQSATASEAKLGAKIDTGDFDVKANEGKLRSSVDLSDWNPWAGRAPMRGFGSRNRGGFFAANYHQPLLTGSSSDYAAVERAWAASSATSSTANMSLRVRMTVALCRPGGMEQAKAWRTLMSELGTDDGKWRKWQDSFCQAVLREISANYLGYGNSQMHVRLDNQGAVEIHPPATNAGDFDLACREAVRKVSRKYGLPFGTQVSEVHARINVTQMPGTMPSHNNDNH